MTHTYATCEVSPATYDEIAAKLRAAGYDHAFDSDTGAIDMHGIGLLRSDAQANPGWVRAKDGLPQPGQLIVKRWDLTGAVWAGIYAGTAKDSSFDDWCALPSVGAPIARPLDEWEEEMGDVIWWRLPVEEPPYVGNPNGSDWPGYHTHWTPLVVPANAEG